MRQDKVYIMIGIYWLANGLVNIPSLYLFGAFGNHGFRSNLILLFLIQFAGHPPRTDDIFLCFKGCET